MTSKKALRNLKALDQIGVVINLRESLTRIRENRIDEAINGLEMYLDCIVTALASDIDRYDAVTKELMVQEFKRLWLYRNNNQGYSANYLDRLDEALRKDVLERRTEVERILEPPNQGFDTAGQSD